MEEWLNSCLLRLAVTIDNNKRIEYDNEPRWFGFCWIECDEPAHLSMSLISHVVEEDREPAESVSAQLDGTSAS